MKKKLYRTNPVRPDRARPKKSLALRSLNFIAEMRMAKGINKMEAMIKRHKVAFRGEACKEAILPAGKVSPHTAAHKTKRGPIWGLALTASETQFKIGLP
jgi:hypothetical protein